MKVPVRIPLEGVSNAGGHLRAGRIKRGPVNQAGSSGSILSRPPAYSDRTTSIYGLAVSPTATESDYNTLISIQCHMAYLMARHIIPAFSFRHGILHTVGAVQYKWEG